MYVASLCFKCFRFFSRMFANISSGCLSRYLRCTYCNGLHTHVSSFSSVFRRMLQIFDMDVSKAYLAGCTCCNGLHTCFICLHTYVANISSKCFESRSSVLHIVIAPVARDHLRFVHKLPDQCRGPVMVSSSTGAWPPGMMQSRGWCAQVREVEGARASEQEARRGMGSRMQV
jgi:hypothetical protein